jgi:hypothetical protein
LIDLQTYSVCLICSSIFHCQFIMEAVTSEPREIDFRCEKGELALDLRRCSGQEVQDQRDEPTAWIDERIQKVSDFPVRLDAGPATVQQSTGRRVPGRDRREGGTRCRGEPDAEAADEQASDDTSTGSLGTRRERSTKSRRSSNTMTGK